MRYVRIFIILLALLAAACGPSANTPAESEANTASDPAVNQSTAPTTADIAGLVTYPQPSRDHDPDLRYDYEELPQHGGVHNPIWMNCGIYTEAIPPELAMHSMEHGAVWITYQADLATADIAALQNIVRGDRHLLLSPYPGQRSPVVLTSWVYQLELDSVSDPRITQFINAFKNDPNTAPEPGVTCEGGFGNPG